MARKRSRIPHARKEALLVQELADELLVYDLENHRAHCLNKTAALVWRHCDGQASPSEMARTLQKELRFPADQELVRFALDQLRRAHLLEERNSPAVARTHYSRREFVKKLEKLGLAAAATLPVVSSLVSPTPAHAMSCVLEPMCFSAGNCTPCQRVGHSKDCGKRLPAAMVSARKKRKPKKSADARSVS